VDGTDVGSIFGSVICLFDPKAWSLSVPPTDLKTPSSVHLRGFLVVLWFFVLVCFVVLVCRVFSFEFDRRVFRNARFSRFSRKFLSTGLLIGGLNSTDSGVCVDRTCRHLHVGKREWIVWLGFSGCWWAFLLSSGL
jgi:hypothetical protein